MGNLFTSNKKFTAKEQLEKIQNEIDKIETFIQSSTVQKKNYLFFLWIAFLIIYPIGLSYIYATFDKNKIFLIISALFIIISPIIAYFFKNFINYYFELKNENSSVRLNELRKNKKSILEKVQETETFIDAKNIFEKYDPSQLRNLSLSLNNLSGINLPLSTQSRYNFRQLNSPPTLTSTKPNIVQNNSETSSPFQRPSSEMPPSSPLKINPQIRTVRPILHQNRSILEKIVDRIFNDGPGNRYALICSNCFSHNGMALPDEIDYLAYNCAYCNKFNPAPKSRPNYVSQMTIEYPSDSLANDNASSSNQNGDNKQLNDEIEDRLKIIELSMTESNKSTNETKVTELTDDENDESKTFTENSPTTESNSDLMDEDA